MQLMLVLTNCLPMLRLAKVVDYSVIEIPVDACFLMMTGDCGDAFTFFVGLDGVGSWDENKTKKCATKSTMLGRVS